PLGLRPPPRSTLFPYTTLFRSLKNCWKAALAISVKTVAIQAVYCCGCVPAARAGKPSSRCRGLPGTKHSAAVCREPWGERVPLTRMPEPIAIGCQQGLNPLNRKLSEVETKVTPTPDPKIVIALDYAEPAAALAMASQLDPARCRLKVGKELFTRGGPALVEQLQQRGFQVFLDLKFHDIPNTTAK